MKKIIYFEDLSEYEIGEHNKIRRALERCTCPIEIKVGHRHKDGEVKEIDMNDEHFFEDTNSIVTRDQLMYLRKELKDTNARVEKLERELASAWDKGWEAGFEAGLLHTGKDDLR